MLYSQFTHHILFNVSANQNGWHQQYEGNVTLREKPFLIKALISRNIEQDVMNKFILFKLKNNATCGR